MPIACHPVIAQNSTDKKKVDYTSISPLYNSVITFDLQQMQRNYLAMRNYIGPKVECAATIKSDAYGVGMAQVAPKLTEVGCQSFFVIELQEALELRKLCPSADIYIYNGVMQGWEEYLVNHNLIPTLVSYEQALRWHEHAKKCNACLPAVLHFDTGMLRSGLTNEDGAKLTAHPEILASFDVRMILSHLACHSIIGHPHNEMQLQRFKKNLSLFPGVKASLASTPAIFLGSQYHFDMVRPGIGLYDIPDNVPNYEESITKSILTLAARIIQVRTAEVGETVSYGATYRITRPSRLATICFGYADGIMRACGRHPTYVMINGFRVPMVGVISMDLIVLDITDIPTLDGHSAVYEGQWVELVNDEIHLREYSTAGETISREILIRLGRRSYRNYLT